MRAFNRLSNVSYTEFLRSINYDFYSLCYHISHKQLRDEDKERIEALPNYDATIFTEITGISFDE